MVTYADRIGENLMSDSIKNLSSLLSKLNQISENSNEILEKSMGKNIKLVQGEAKTLCPVDNGDLINSINTKVESTQTGVRGIVYTNSDHAAYVEFGTGKRGSASPSPPKSDTDISYNEDWTGMDAQPYLYPALKNNKETVINRIAADIKKSIEDVAK